MEQKDNRFLTLQRREQEIASVRGSNDDLIFQYGDKWRPDAIQLLHDFAGPNGAESGGVRWSSGSIQTIANPYLPPDMLVIIRKRDGMITNVVYHQDVKAPVSGQRLLQFDMQAVEERVVDIEIK